MFRRNRLVHKSCSILDIPTIFMTDGPLGLHKAEGFDFTNSVPSILFRLHRHLLRPGIQHWYKKWVKP
ncbi:hypothetical protein [Flavobacterium sp. GSP27]|uniref:hypothetical protein n=1 Tax=Flavobacterium sp. GSP27 TaxID=2497489 RepID=UPI0013150A12|nr:hypothetical protein [Flavobacterium sp. GSP27]